MNLQDFFTVSGSSYEEIHNRISSDSLLKKFLRQFLEDTTFKSLEQAISKKEYKNVFFASHSLKGVCSNLGLSNLEKKLIVLLEYLRTNSENPNIDEKYCNDLFYQIKQDYEKVTSAIKTLEN